MKQNIEDSRNKMDQQIGAMVDILLWNENIICLICIYIYIYFMFYLLIPHSNIDQFEPAKQKIFKSCSPVRRTTPAFEALVWFHLKLCVPKMMESMEEGIGWCGNPNMRKQRVVQLHTPWKFNIALQKLPSQKESSFFFHHFWGAKLNFGDVPGGGHKVWTTNERKPLQLCQCV